MSKSIKNITIKSSKKVKINGEIKKYYENVLKSLDLSVYYIYRNNFTYFGYDIIYNQEKTLEKFNNIEEDFNSFVEYILTNYNYKILLVILGNVYTKLQEIHTNNDYILGNINNKNEDVSYASKAADLMARKLKTLIEMVLMHHQEKGKNYFKKKDYKRLIILLYYYSIYIFYSVRTKYSKKYENGVTEFWIDPKSISPIYTQIEGQDNSKNDNDLYYNYDSNKERIIDQTFNEAFLKEKGILFTDFTKLMNQLLESLETLKKHNGIILSQKLNDYIKEKFPNCNLELFNKECVLKQDSFESDENNLYKNTCKHRLDTTPIIYFEKSKYLINKGIITNSINIWNNAHFIGLKPYSTPEDNISQAIDKIIHKISYSLESDIISILKDITPFFKIYRNRKTKHIFPKMRLDENEWDIIAIDNDNKYIFDIESKFLSTSMTELGLSNDLEKLEEYKKAFEKRITIENDNIEQFLKFCNADRTFNIIHIMVTSKVVDSNITSNTRRFAIIHYDGFKKYILKNYYNSKIKR